MFRKLKRYLRDPYYEIGYDLLRYSPKLMSDKWWLSVVWKMQMGYKIDWNNPKSFNEKLQWLKLYYHNPLYTILVDKIKVKEYVASLIGEEYIIPTLAVYKDVNEINLDLLPDKFILKCNHDCGSIVICKDKSNFNTNEAKANLKKALKKNFYWNSREWVYKNVVPSILAEPYLEDEETHDLPDYKFFAFDGEVKVVLVATSRSSTDIETRFDYFDVNYQHLDLTDGDKNAEIIPKKPKNFEMMIRLSQILSRGIPHVRCDFYEVSGKVYFGELTFYQQGGITKFNPASFDDYLGSMIRLPL